ncbi:MAG TPA: DUF502 domain-containing protein [Nitrospira sp.]|nr:DUF502 domain-containing protein [Nitrospira sp.]
MTRAWHYFVPGLLVLVPAWATFLVLAALLSTVNQALAELVGYLGLSAAPGLGLVVIVVLVFLTGVMATHVVGRRLLTAGERWISNIPVIRTVYLTLKGMTDLFQFRQRFGRSTVVAFPFPRDGLWALGFVMGNAPRNLQIDGSGTLTMVFVPTAVHPFTGYLAFIPSAVLHRLNLPPEEAMKMEFSAGFYKPAPGWLGPPKMPPSAS